MAEKKTAKKTSTQTTKRKTAAAATKPAKAVKATRATPKAKATRKRATKSTTVVATAAPVGIAATTAAVKEAGARHANGFIEFIRTQGVVGLAVGLAIGTAAGDTVKKMVEGFITPIVQLLVGSQKGLEAATWTLEVNGRTGDFKWGAFVSSAITLLATAFVIYLIVHFAKLNKLDKKKDE